MLISRIIDYLYLASQKFLEVFSDFFAIFYIRFFVIIILGINAFSWLTAFIIKATASDYLIILHYNVDFGVDLIGTVNRVFIIPFLGLAVIVFTVVLLINLNKDSLTRKNFIFMSYSLLTGALLSNVFLLVAIASVYLINFK